MKKHFLTGCWVFWVGFVFASPVFGVVYQSEHFIIYSDMNPSYVRMAQANAEAFYDNLAGKYFKGGWTEPLTIYCCEDQDQADRFLVANGHKDGAEGYYAALVPAVYAYHFDSGGNAVGWFGLFHGIASHLIEVNSQKGSELFKKELVYFLAAQSKIVKGGLFFEEPDLGGLRVSDENIEDMVGNCLRALFAAAGAQSVGADAMRAFTPSFFCWLDDKGILKNYLYRVYKKDYKLAILEQTAQLRYGQIKEELASEIRQNKTACDYLDQSRYSSDAKEAEETVLMALRLRPDSYRTQLEVASFYYDRGNYKRCREMLKPIMVGAANDYSRSAARLAGDSCYKEKDYKAAMEHYETAWEYSDYYEYKYRLAYRMANCCHYLENTTKAKRWYESFLAERWEQDQMQAGAEYAAKYLEPEKPVSETIRASQASRAYEEQ